MGPVRFFYRSFFVLLFAALPAGAQDFSNPLFASQDPYVTYWEGNYYYTQSGHNQIQVIKSPTLTGLKGQTPIVVWTSPLVGPDGHANLWAPEIHQVNGKWYIYFSADYDSSGRHKLYVLAGGTDPLDAYQVANTGAPNGQIVESSGHWAIDPDVFMGPDNQLYLIWSCTNYEVGTTPQYLCLARMQDALHTATATVQISVPSEPWETRTAPIEEGPIGFVHDGAAYVTFSGSASWTPNDYSVGVLTNPSGNLLDPHSWVKSGPILDHHGTAYGPGSVVFAPSADGTELWTLYHSYDALNCGGWACRSIRAQKVSWDANGLPLLGYPMNPGVKTWAPSGDMGSQTGWGDAHSGTAAAGGWTYNGMSSVDSPSGGGNGSWQQTFHGELNPIAYSVSTNMQLDAGSTGQYGLTGIYKDADDHVEAFIDAGLRMFVSSATVGGRDQGQRSSSLPADFDITVSHTITVEKSAANLYTFSLDGSAQDLRTFSIDFGQIGLLATDSGAHFRGVTIADKSFGWGDAFGDAAEGLSRAYNSVQPENGYVHGSWTIQDGATVESSQTGADWNALYQGNPNFMNYTVRVDAQLAPGGSTAAPPRFGLIACHDDRNNSLSVWLDPGNGNLVWSATVQGQGSSISAALPSGFDATQWHTLAVTKNGDLFSFSLDGDVISQQTFPLANGTAGVITQSADVYYRNFTVLDR
jgi:GH43 family beta-xylosidase